MKCIQAIIGNIDYNKEINNLKIRIEEHGNIHTIISIYSAYDMFHGIST